MRRSVLIASFILGCGAGSSAVAPPNANESGNANRVIVSGPHVDGSYRVAFRDITSTPGCFFFSGPGVLGRDDQLGDAASYDGRVLSFSSGHTFVGQDVLLVRDAPHEYAGTWTSRETIELLPIASPMGDGFVGRYHYDEYEPGTTSPGRCQIDARIELWPVP